MLHRMLSILRLAAGDQTQASVQVSLSLSLSTVFIQCALNSSQRHTLLLPLQAWGDEGSLVLLILWHFTIFHGSLTPAHTPAPSSYTLQSPLWLGKLLCATQRALMASAVPGSQTHFLSLLMAQSPA